MKNQHPVIAEDVESVVRALGEHGKKLEGKKVLISGGAGFLGSYIVATLVALNEHLAKPCKVIVQDNFITGARQNTILDAEDPNVELMEHDVRKPMPEGVRADYVIHAAGLASPFYYRKFPLETIEVAVNGTKNFLEFAKNTGLESMLYFSSSEVYGDPHPNAIPTPETYWGNVSQVGPRACYDESKRLGETLCSIYQEHFGVPVKIVRPFNIYGPGMKVTDYRVIPTFMANGLAGKPLAVHDKGIQTRTFCYISDAVAGLLLVLLAGENGHAYNVGNDEDEVSMLELADLVNEVLPKKTEVKLIDYPPTYPAGEPQRRAPDLGKIRTQLGYKPKVTLREGLRRTLEWYRHVINSSEKHT